MAISATYVSSHTFTVAGSHTNILHQGRRVECNCLDDGFKYGTISGSTYSNPNTVIDLTSLSSDLTPNLLTIKYGIIGKGSTQSMPVHSHDGSEGSGGFLDTEFELVSDLTPQLGGELDAQSHSIGFIEQTISGTASTTDVDWKLGNKVRFNFGPGTENFTFTEPSNVCNLLISLHHGTVNSGTITWPSSVKWVGGTEPDLTTTLGGIDIVSFYFDGTDYFGAASLAFA